MRFELNSVVNSWAVKVASAFFSVKTFTSDLAAEGTSSSSSTFSISRMVFSGAAIISPLIRVSGVMWTSSSWPVSVTLPSGL